MKNFLNLIQCELFAVFHILKDLFQGNQDYKFVTTILRNQVSKELCFDIVSGRFTDSRAIYILTRKPLARVTNFCIPLEDVVGIIHTAFFNKDDFLEIHYRLAGPKANILQTYIRRAIPFQIKTFGWKTRPSNTVNFDVIGCFYLFPKE